MAGDTFSFRFGFWKPLLAVFGMGPARSRVEVDRSTVRVRMGWAFRAKIDRATIVRAFADTNKYWGIGVHGWGGSWLVNGSVSGIVTVAIDPPGTGSGSRISDSPADPVREPRGPGCVPRSPRGVRPATNWVAVAGLSIRMNRWNSSCTVGELAASERTIDCQRSTR